METASTPFIPEPHHRATNRRRALLGLTLSTIVGTATTVSGCRSLTRSGGTATANV